MISELQLDVRFFAPPADLAPCFTTFYRLEIALPTGRTVTDALQPEWANLRFFAEHPPEAGFDGGAAIKGARFQATGPSSRPARFTLRPTRMWGVGLHPLGWARYVGAPACAHANTIVDGEKSAVFDRFAALCAPLCRRGGEDKTQFAALIDFFRAAGPPPRDEARIRAVHEALVDPLVLDVGALAERSALTKRTLERVCLKHFGFAPRLLLRRQRLMRTLAAFMLGEGANWTKAIDRQYHDQAHFVHEFHSFMGMSPSEYAAAPHPILAAFMAERQRIWGSPAQTLDTPR